MRRAWMTVAVMTWAGGASAQAYDPVDIAAIKACPSFEAPRQIVQNLGIMRLNEMQRRRSIYGVGGSGQVTCETAQTVQAAFRKLETALRRCSRHGRSAVISAASQKWSRQLDNENDMERNAGCPTVGR